MERILTTWPNDVQIVFKHNPLSIHKRAEAAALASSAAHYQGKFWEYHDELWARKQFSDAALEAIARDIGLDVALWKSDKDSQAVYDKVKHDQASMVALGARGTPAFFINGVYVKGAQPFPKFKEVIEQQLKAADAEIAKGTALADVHRVLAQRNNGAGFVDSVIDGKKPDPSAARAAAKKPRRQEKPQDKPVEITVTKDDPYKGPKNAPITIVEFSDFECPFCGKMLPVIEEIRKNYPKEVKIVFKQQPLSFHKNARPAAMASLAAHEQGKFWEMHDILFQNKKALRRADLDRYAEQIGLNMKKYKAAMDSNKFEAQIAADQKVAARVGASGTPTSFVNGWKVRGAAPFSKFKTVIDRELEKVKGAKGGKKKRGR